MREPGLVPELYVTRLERSLDFWCGACGFARVHERPAERFAALRLGSARVMLEELGAGRQWVTAPLEPPFGRGLNLEIHVADLDRVLRGLRAARVELRMAPEVREYGLARGRVARVRQFLVQDPDGWLLRFQTPARRGD